MIISQSLLLWGQGLWKFKNFRLKRSTHDYFTDFPINAAEGIEFLFGDRVMLKLGRIVWKAKNISRFRQRSRSKGRHVLGFRLRWKNGLGF